MDPERLRNTSNIKIKETIIKKKNSWSVKEIGHELRFTVTPKHVFLPLCFLASYSCLSTLWSGRHKGNTLHASVWVRLFLPALKT